MYLIVGAGVAGIFTTLELLSNGVNGKDITIIEKGNFIEERKCFTNENTKCKKCKICSLLHGFAGGGGAMNDGKMNLIDLEHPQSVKIGGDLIKYHSLEELSKLSDRVLEYYNQFGMSEMDVIPMGDNLDKNGLDILEKIKKNPRLSVAMNRVIHVGSDRSRIIYKNIQNYLIEQGVNLLMNVILEDLIVENNVCKGIITNKGRMYADKVIIATGRYGNEQIGQITNKHRIEKKKGSVDIGVRVEVNSDIMKPFDSFYELKLYYEGLYGDIARVFCYNKRGVVVNEKYDMNNQVYTTVNGHAFNDKRLKTKNDNFAILVKRELDLNNPLDNYVLPIIKINNILGNGTICQTFTDLIFHKSTTEESLKRCSIKPTLKSNLGDLSDVIPYRILKTIIDMIYELERLCEGVAYGNNTLLHGIEAKFHSNGIKIKDGSGETSMQNLYCIGDCSSYTRGIVQSASMGILCGRKILDNSNK